MWLAVARTALVVFLAAGCATILIVYIVRRRAGHRGWGPTVESDYGDSMGGQLPDFPALPQPVWTSRQDDDRIDDGPPSLGDR